MIAFKEEAPSAPQSQSRLPELVDVKSLVQKARVAPIPERLELANHT